MRILLINPPRFEGIPVIREERCEITERYSVLEPYSLLQIAGILRQQGHRVRLIDANGLDLDWSQTRQLMQQEPYDAVVFRFTPTTFDADMETAKVSKEIQPSAFTAAICWTLKDLPRQVLRDAFDLDGYIMQEYETVVPALIEALANGQSLDRVAGLAYRNAGENKVNRAAQPLENYDSIPLPAFDLLPSLAPYYINTPHGRPFTIMYASKGCPFGCNFCTVRRTTFKKKSAGRILDELRYLRARFGVRTVSFFDETFTLDKERVFELCEAMKREDLELRWYCNTRVELVSKDLLRRMRESGCRGIAFGVESGSQQILDNVEKGNTVQEAENAVKASKDVGIKTYCSFIVGLPGETWETIEETIAFVKRTRPTGAQFNIAVPYPGTPMYELAAHQGWTKPAIDWRQLYQHSANMRTDSLGEDELKAARRMMYRKLYFDPMWLLGNLYWVLRYPEDFNLGVRYLMKILKNYFLYRMEHAH